MVRCPDCETPNSVDSKFCKFCGAGLPDEERMDAQVKLNALIAEGYRLFNEGRTDEALLIAESALTSSPAAPQALSLKGMCHERLGNLAEALELYEKVVEVNPDSALDKIKVTHVRNLLAAKIANIPPPNRRVALFGAVAAVVLVMSVGAIVASGMGPAQVAGQPSKEPGAPEVVPFSGAPAGVPQGSGTGASGQTPAPITGGGGTAERGGTTTQLPRLPDWGGGQTIPGTGDVEVRPVNPRIPTDGPRPEDPPRPSQPGGTQPGDEPPKIDDKPARDPMQGVDIKVRTPGNRVGGSEALEGGNQLQALLSAGREQFQLGNYAGAAKTYERAVAAGGDAASLNQRVGQCYDHLGRKSEAINAYTAAATAYATALAKTDSPALRNGLQACQRALRLLKGQ